MVKEFYFTGKCNNPLTRFKHASLDDAQEWIDSKAESDPDGVERGDYYIDGPVTLPGPDRWYGRA